MVVKHIGCNTFVLFRKCRYSRICLLESDWLLINKFIYLFVVVVVIPFNRHIFNNNDLRHEKNTTVSLLFSQTDEQNND